MHSVESYAALARSSSPSRSPHAPSGDQSCQPPAPWQRTGGSRASFLFNPNSSVVAWNVQYSFAQMLEADLVGLNMEHAGRGSQSAGCASPRQGAAFPRLFRASAVQKAALEMLLPIFPMWASALRFADELRSTPL